MAKVAMGAWLLLPDTPSSKRWAGLLLFLGSTAMMVFNFYLMYLLPFEIEAVCL
jgi:uncharacterized membrane protein